MNACAHDINCKISCYVPRFDMQQYGFDGYALNYVDCPEGIKYFLMKEINLHRSVRIHFRCFC
jgi:hypothetical protein